MNYQLLVFYILPKYKCLFASDIILAKILKVVVLEYYNVTESKKTLIKHSVNLCVNPFVRRHHHHHHRHYYNHHLCP